jgi:hypothetical protein
MPDRVYEVVPTTGHSAESLKSTHDIISQLLVA